MKHALVVAAILVVLLVAALAGNSVEPAQPIISPKLTEAEEAALFYGSDGERWPSYTRKPPSYGIDCGVFQMPDGRWKYTTPCAPEDSEEWKASRR